MDARMMTFGEKLKAFRQAAGLSQRALAEKAGISQKAVDHYERDAREPGWSAVQALAVALCVTCEAFADAPTAKNLARKSKSRNHGRAPKGDRK